MNMPDQESRKVETENHIAHTAASSLISESVNQSFSPVDKIACKQREINRTKVLLFFGTLIALTFLLRFFYARHLFQDDGLWFTAAEEILRGKALYREIYFDKPPALPLLYAALFKLFGAHIITIRLFAIFYSVAVSAVIYLFGSWLYDRRAGMLAALMFTFFSTTSVNNHTQGLNTDFLMLLPYTAGAYLFVRACFEKRWLSALAGGALAGVAMQTNPKGIFILIFFALLLLITARQSARDKTQSILPVASAARLFALAVIGFIAGTLPFLAWIAASDSLSDYWLFVWDWGSRYAGYYPKNFLTHGLRLTLTYLARNNTLLFALIFLIATAARHAIQARKRQAAVSDIKYNVNQRAVVDFAGQGFFKSDVTLLLWLAVSYAGLAVGGRFYSNYFFQVLPSLCLIGARGLTGIVLILKSRPAFVRRAAIALLAIGFQVTVVRFHTRTVALAVDWMRGTTSGMNAQWYHEKLNREEMMVAALVRDLPDGADRACGPDVEAMRGGGPRERAPEGSSDYLLVWGSRSEIYYWSGLLPASRYLIAQPLTGVPADVQHTDSHSVLDEAITAAARAELARDLERARPKYIVDEIGFFNPALSIKSYSEFSEIMKGYKYLGAKGRFLIYQKKESAN